MKKLILLSIGLFFGFASAQDVCTLQYDPVCGEKNGIEKTYGNSCQANNDGAITKYKGECNAGGDLTACTKEYAPVCGLVQVQCFVAPCDQIPQSFSNSCLMSSAGATLLHTGTCYDTAPWSENSIFVKKILDDYFYKKGINASNTKLQIIRKLKSAIRNIIQTALIQDPQQLNLLHSVLDGLSKYANIFYSSNTLQFFEMPTDDKLIRFSLNVPTRMSNRYFTDSNTQYHGGYISFLFNSFQNPEFAKINAIMSGDDYLSNYGQLFNARDGYNFYFFTGNSNPYTGMVAEELEEFKYIFPQIIDTFAGFDRSNLDEYIRQNINNISPISPVLGGNFFVTNIEWISDNTAIVTYEDGHIENKIKIQESIKNGKFAIEVIEDL